MRKIEKHVFDSQYALSNNLVEMSRKELCELVAEICRQIKAESGNKAYHGGVYPENISCSPDGTISFGPKKRSDWSAQELQYIAPEIYWNNKPCPQSDVYALGLILYYGASAGKLPFEGEGTNAQLMRMSGKTVYAPAAAGKQLGDIIEKALRFKENDRYRSPEELAIMLDYCEDNRLLKEKTGAEAIFHKDTAELSELEQMMLNIIEGKAEPDLTEEHKTGEDELIDEIVTSVRNDGSETVKTEDEIFSEAGLKRPEPTHKAADEKVDLAEIFGLDEPDPRDPAELEEEEEIRLYEPREKRGIPILTEEKDPELAPITVKNKKGQTRGQSKTQVRTEHSSQEETTQKKRPLLVVFLLLAVLLIAAVVANILINAFSGSGDGRGASNVVVVVPSAEPTDDPTVAAILSEEQIQYQQQLEQQAQMEMEQQAQQQAEMEQTVPEVDPATLPHSYEVVKADVGWVEAQQAAIARGGYLVTINSPEELQQVTELAAQAGIDRVWVGAHRVDGNLVWESGEDNIFYQWDVGEPSYTDSGDGAAEDYVLLWQHNGAWAYNDSRENPLTNFYGMYGGHIGYVVEIVG